MKILAWSASEMPMPVSATAISIAPCRRRALIFTVPPSAVNLMALEIRFSSICLSLPASASTTPAVHACGHRGHELLHTIHLVVADRRGERPGHHDQASDALEAVDRKRDQCHCLAAAALIPADAVGQVGQQLLQLLSEVRVDAGG